MQKIDTKERHELLMKNLNHYLWNVPYNKWTEQDYENLKNGISNGYVKSRANTGCLSPVALIDENGTTTEYKSIADASRKTGINASTIYAAVMVEHIKEKEIQNTQSNGSDYKTKPILFSTEMVQAILEGRKTQTRRTKGLEKVNENPDGHTFNSFSIDNKNANFKRLEGMWQGVDVPYQCGDILWVRETVFDYKNFREFPIFSNIKENYIYKANGHSIGCHKWKPSIHMPKDAARLF